MKQGILIHLQKHIDKNKRLKSSYLFDDNGKVCDLIKQEIENNHDDFIIGIEQYFVETINLLENGKKFNKVKKWLSKNCKVAWMPWINAIGFIDKSDAALFQLFWSSDFF